MFDEDARRYDAAARAAFPPPLFPMSHSRATARDDMRRRLGRRRADREYLTGFHKRRKERQRVAAEDLRRKEKLARQKARLEVRGPHGIGQGLRSWRI